MKSNTKTYSAQILVITLLILGVITIAVLSIISILNKDSSQVVSNKKYEILNNAAEVHITNAVKAHNTSPTLSDLSSLIPTCSFSSLTAGKLTYNCQDSSNILSAITVRSTVTVEDKKDVTNKEIKADEALSINIFNYKGLMRIEWTGDFALEFNMILRTPTNDWVTINDVFDRHAVLSSLTSDNPYIDPESIHDFIFTDPITTSPNDLEFDINTILNSLGYSSYTPQLLVITPRNKEIATTLVSVNGLSSGFPNQVRQFNAISFDNTDNSSPTAEVKAEVLLQPQVDAIFDYALLTPGLVNL